MNNNSVVNNKRKLATIRIVDDIQPIPKADRLEVAMFGGWKVVVQKGEFKPGDLAIYIEIDSWIPHKLAPFLDRGTGPTEYGDISGYRLRTIRLRGQISQGLALPINILPTPSVVVGDNVTEYLGIIKWEPPLKFGMDGMAKGSMPHFIQKTDLERIQNIPDILKELHPYEIQWKADGTSCTVYVDQKTSGICSRTVEWKLDPSNKSNLYTQIAVKSKLLSALQIYHEQTGENIAVQGEIVGPGIQKNRGKYATTRFLAFDIWDIDRQCYLPSREREPILDKIQKLGWDGYRVEDFSEETNPTQFTSIDQFLTVCDELCRKHQPPAEGLVFKSLDGQYRFKAISNNYLLKE
jgi:RNA ligase (TIGR02306 family)